MYLSAQHAPNLRLTPPLNTPTTTLTFLTKASIYSRQFRLYRKRRRLKLSIRSDFSFSSDNLFHSLLSQFPSLNSLDALAPALGLFSGLALYLSRFTPSKPDEISCVGNWVLFTSPTPFNRFVVLRCPSISFEGSDLLEDVNKKLVKEDRHFVRLNRGRIQGRSGGGRDDGVSEMELKLDFQRVCVNTDDGGVISLDWPANLDLHEEHGLDTTLLLVPGTAEGSMEKRLRLFVCEALKRGFFPVVMNPRGCGGSPLTTARYAMSYSSSSVV